MMSKSLLIVLMLFPTLCFATIGEDLEAGTGLSMTKFAGFISFLLQASMWVFASWFTVHSIADLLNSNTAQMGVVLFGFIRVAAVAALFLFILLN